MPAVGMWELATEIVRQEGYVAKWRLEGDDAEELAVRYLLLLQRARDFEVSFQCGYTHQGRRGVLWIFSSDESTRTHMEGYGRLDGHPPCMEFHVYFLEGMDLGDVRDGLFQLPEPLFLGPLWAFVGAVYPHFSLEALRSYPQREGQLYFDVLREIVALWLGAPCWIEVSVCRSFLQYRALNVYWSLRTPGDGQVDPSWWLVNWEEPPRSRRQVHPAKWYRCQDYLWVGRAGAHADYLLRSLEGGGRAWCYVPREILPAGRVPLHRICSGCAWRIFWYYPACQAWFSDAVCHPCGLGGVWRNGFLGAAREHRTW